MEHCAHFLILYYPAHPQPSWRERARWVQARVSGRANKPCWVCGGTTHPLTLTVTHTRTPRAPLEAATSLAASTRCATHPLALAQAGTGDAGAHDAGPRGLAGGKRLLRVAQPVRHPRGLSAASVSAVGLRTCWRRRPSGLKSSRLHIRDLHARVANRNASVWHGATENGPFERGANPKRSRRACSPRCGLHSWGGNSAGVAKRPP